MQGMAGDVLVLVGTKAQFIKTAPVILEMDRRGVAYRLVYTGQHSETFEALEAVFGTRPPDDVLVPNVEADTARGLLWWAGKFCKAAYSRWRLGAWRGARWGVVHGDTASTLLCAMALRLIGVRVAHIEAGLRSPRLLSPFPEEIIRRLVSGTAQLHLAPDDAAVANLSGRSGVVDTGGNTLRDALVGALGKLSEKSGGFGGDGGYAVVSLHRSENLAHASTFGLLMRSVVETSRVLPVRFVLHPVTKRKLQRSHWLATLQREPGVTLLERMDYVSFVEMMIGARFLMTDGGSNQEEAAMLGLPTILMRDATERPDGMEAGTVILSRLDEGVIRKFVQRHAFSRWPIHTVTNNPSPSARIVDALAC